MNSSDTELASFLREIGATEWMRQGHDAYSHVANGKCPYCGVQLVLIPLHGWNSWNRMHDKFCIIDFEYVMHGSYNWRKTANFNDETLATAFDRDFVKRFADEFIHLYTKGHPVN